MELLKKVKKLEMYSQSFFIGYLNKPKQLFVKKNNFKVHSFLLCYNAVFNAACVDSIALLLEKPNEEFSSFHKLKLDYQFRSQENFNSTLIYKNLSDSKTYSLCYSSLQSVWRQVEQFDTPFFTETTEENIFKLPVPLEKLTALGYGRNLELRLYNLISLLHDFECKEFVEIEKMKKEVESLFLEYNKLFLALLELLMCREKILTHCFTLRIFPVPEFFSILTLLSLDAKIMDLVAKFLGLFNSFARFKKQLVYSKKIRLSRENSEKTLQYLSKQAKADAEDLIKEFEKKKTMKI